VTLCDGDGPHAQVPSGKHAEPAVIIPPPGSGSPGLAGPYRLAVSSSIIGTALYEGGHWPSIEWSPFMGK
jgi:hypothetical protein